MSQFGRNYSILYPNYPSVAGPTNIGWYFRSIYGAPAYWFIRNIQIAPNNFVVLSMKYPKKTSFNITTEFSWTGSRIAVPEASSMNEIYTERETLYTNVSDYVCSDIQWPQWEWCNKTGADNVGPMWYFDRKSGFFYLRVVHPWYYFNYYPRYVNEFELFWETEGMKLWDIDYAFKFHINATCDGCRQSVMDGFYDVKDALPPKWPHQEW
eukprot:UN08966